MRQNKFRCASWKLNYLESIQNKKGEGKKTVDTFVKVHNEEYHTNGRKHERMRKEKLKCEKFQSRVDGNDCHCVCCHRMISDKSR